MRTKEIHVPSNSKMEGQVEEGRVARGQGSNDPQIREELGPEVKRHGLEMKVLWYEQGGGR